MKKRLLCQILAFAVILSIFSGCDFQMTMLPNNTKPTSTKPTESLEVTQPTESTGSTEPTGNPPGIELPEENFNFINGVYATCENYDFTIYRGMVTEPTLQFWLICEKPLPENAQIVLKDVTATYKVSIYDRSVSTSNEFLSGANAMLYAYLSDPDLDFVGHIEEYFIRRRDYYELYYEVYGEDGKQPGETYPPDHEYAEAFEQAEKRLSEYQHIYNDPYDAYKATEPLEQYYKYEVKIPFTGVGKAEQIQSMELIAGDMSRTITMRNVWVAPYSYDLNSKGVTKNVSIKDSQGKTVLPSDTRFTLDTHSEQLLNNRYSSMCYFVANEDITLKSMYPYGKNTRITPEWAELLIIGTNGSEMIVQWTPGKDFMIRKGEKVAMKIYWTDQYAALTDYGMNMSIVVEYQCQGETCQTWGEFVGAKELESYLYYLTVFEGVDLSRYYKEYVTNIPKWQKMIDETQKPRQSK